MRQATIWWIASLSLAALGCSGGSGGLVPDPATSNIPAGDSTLSGFTARGDVAEAVMAIFTLEVDPGTSSAAFHLKETRTSQATDDVYHLSIGNFINSGTVKITDVNVVGSNIDIGYTVTHPFAGPSNLDGPATAANRADLGISGRVVFLADVTSAVGNTFFTDVIADTALVANADGFVQPNGLLGLTGFTANAFPYKALVDEQVDGRTSTASGSALSNGGSVTGNYDPALGWQRSNIGAGNDGWTGYGTLHQGQTASNTLSLDLNAFSGSPFSLDTAILAKYQDPRGGANAAQKKANRLPAATADIAQFAYRRPHGSLDIESVRFSGESGGYLVNQISASTLSFQVADWDARATETVETDLALDTDPTKVAIGESGIPAISVSIPGVTGDETSTVDLTAPPVDDDTAVGGDAGIDSGTPGDALYYSELVTKTVVSGQSSGDFIGMARVEDVENTLTTDWSFPLDPDLGLLTANLPEAVVFQSFTVSQETLPPTATSWSVTTANVLSGGTASISISGITDPEAEPIDVLVDWDNDTVYTLATTVNDPYPGAVPLTSPITYTHSGSDPDVRTIKVRISDGSNTVDLLPNGTFTVTNCPSLAFAGLNLGGSPGGSGGSFLPAGMTMPNLDMASYPRYNTTWQNGAHVHQRAGATFEFWGFTNNAGTAVTQSAMTNFGGSLTKRAHQIDVDLAGRVLFGTVTAAYVSNTAFGDTSSLYGANGAEPNFHWFDFATPAGSPVAVYNTVNTGADRVMAMTVDQSGNVYFIDQNHILHKYVKGPGVTGYTESTAAPFPWNLLTVLGDPNGAAGTDANRKVSDLVFNFRNRNIFILTQSQGVSPNARMHRLECDGTIAPTIAGNPNPNLFALNTNVTQTWTADIYIDQLGTDGQILTTQGEAQIVITQSSGGVTPALGDLRFFNTNMQNTSTISPWGGYGYGHISVTLHNQIGCMYPVNTTFNPLQIMVQNFSPWANWK